MRHYLNEVKLYGTQQGFIHDFWARKSGQAPKWNHTPGTFAPQPMPVWHLKVPDTHLEKPLGLIRLILATTVSR